MTDKILFIPLDGTPPRMEVEIPQAQLDATRARALAETDEHLKRSVADVMERAAGFWYGYGRWDAPYWFVGLEPGKGKREGQNLADRCNAWENLGEKDLIDCRAHHEQFNTEWHNRRIKMDTPVDGETFRPPPQRTWRRLITLLLAFKGDRRDTDMIGHYQARRWGTTDPDGETCLIELSSLASNSLADDKALKEMSRSYRHRRLQLIRARILVRHPTFVILYGGGKAAYKTWAYLASGTPRDCFRVQTIDGWDAGFFYDGRTVFVRAKHPVSRGAPAPPESYWTGIASNIKSLLESQ